MLKICRESTCCRRQRYRGPAKLRIPRNATSWISRATRTALAVRPIAAGYQRDVTASRSNRIARLVTGFRRATAPCLTVWNRDAWQHDATRKRTHVIRRFSRFYAFFTDVETVVEMLGVERILRSLFFVSNVDISKNSVVSTRTKI